MISKSRQWLLVAILTSVSMLAMIDKNLLQLMVDPIKADLGLSDVQISLILGAAFALANLAASLPAGWLADRGNRGGIIASGVVIWSAATAASGAAHSFAALFAARAAVGCGEGIIPPACYSLMHDGVEPSRRGRALSVYTMATTAGSGIALLVCGALIAAVAARGIDHVPLIGDTRPWQTALVIIGLVGLPVALLTLLLPRVPRSRADTATQSSYGDAFRLLRSRKSVLMPLLIYSIAQAMLMATMGSWVPALIGRSFGLAPQTLGPILGSMLIVCGLAGLSVVGLIIDRLNLRGLQGAAIVGLGAALLFTIAGAIMPHIRSLGLFWTIEALVLLGTTPFLVVTAEIVARETPAHMVGKLMAIFLFAQALIGYSFAPTLTAILSQHVYAATGNPLGAAISTMVIVLGTIEIAMIALAWRNLGMAAPLHPMPTKGSVHDS